MNIHTDTMERIIPDNIQKDDAAAQLSLKLHLERYQFACKHLLPGRVLDIACGMGYGTRMLADCSGQNCVGVDISADAISYANNRYAHTGIKFVNAALMDFHDDEKFENIVSLETIEHIHDPDRVVDHLRTLLKPGGRLIISAPVTPSTDGNSFHVNDFSERSFRKLFTSRGFKEIGSLEQSQKYLLRDVVGKKSSRGMETKRSLIKYYLTHPVKFFLRLRSLLSDGLCNRYLVLVLG